MSPEKPPTDSPDRSGDALRTDDDVAPGRPVALTPEKRRRLLRALRIGGAREDAAHRAGIGKSTLFRYLADGREQRKAAREADQESQPKPGSCWELLEAVEAAHAEFRFRYMRRIEKCAKGAFEPKDIPALLSVLRTIFPDRFPTAQSHEISGPKGGPVKFEGKSEVRGVVVLPPVADDDPDEPEPTP